MTGDALARSRDRWGVTPAANLTRSYEAFAKSSLRESRVMFGADWPRLLGDHHTYLTVRNLAPGTIRVYRYLLLDLALRFPLPGQITGDDLLETMARPGRGPDGMKTARSAYRSLFRWAHRTGRLPADPSQDLPAIKHGRRLPRPTPEPVIEIGLRDATAREQFMIELGAYAGLRCCEIACLHARDWDGYRRRLLVHGKGSKERLVPITDDQLLARLDAVVGYAFPNRWTGAPITPGTVCKLLSTALAGTWTGHTLRHRFGTEALEDTKDLAAVAEVMGHEQVETTRIYTKVSTDRLIAVSRGAGRRTAGAPYAAA